MGKIRSNSIRMLGFLLLLFLAACVGNRQPASQVAGISAVGPAGPQGERGAPGPAGKDGQPGKDFAPPGLGLKIKITGVTLNDSGKPVVALTMTDENDISLKANALEGSGFTIAQVEEDATTHLTRYQSLLVHDVEGKPYQWNGETRQPALAKATQAYADSGGDWADLSNGKFTYTFKNKLSATANPNLLTVVGIYAWRNNKQSVANDVYNFVLGGSLQVAERQVVSDAACQNCHNPLEAHGGVRRSVELCVTCHTDQTVDPETGNSLNLKVLIHRVHFGAQLPSVKAGKPFLIVGHQQSVTDLSHDVWPQDLRYCITCHTGGAQSSNFKKMPNAAACTSCHDTTNLTTGENHPGGIQTDTQCALCHPADGNEFDSSITGAHTIITQSKNVKGIHIDILSVDGAKAGGSPVVKFKVTDSSGAAVTMDQLADLAVTLAGPTSDYANRWTETIVNVNAKDTPKISPAVKDAGSGAYEYQFKAQIPVDATGTYAVGMEGYVMETIVPDKDPVRVAAFNPVAYAALDGGKPAPRRQVIDQTKCNVCHMKLEAHGTIRQNVEYCVLCHNTRGTDAERRPADAMPPTSINFPLLVHGIHNGANASNPLQVYGYGNKLNDFSKVVFPGDISACQTCHLPNTYGFPLAKGIQPTVITQDGKEVKTILPTRAICTSCHTSAETGGHIDLQTTPAGVETCTVCHGPGREFDVNKAHH